MSIVLDKTVIEKFDIPGPRYTSYPTAPVWSTSVTDKDYVEKLKIFGETDKTLSLYVHIPFCETMCTYCACSVVIRRADEKYGNEYLKYLKKEIDLVAGYIGAQKTIKQLHWGGGTPTYFSEAQIKELFHYIEDKFDIDYNGEVAIEIDPRTVDKAKIKMLKALGFNRISLGIQDFNAEVQKDINRVQPYELVKDIYQYCRSLNFEFINFDLIYGLPNQTPQNFSNTITKVIALKPNRIALYSFAYVPWFKAHQKKINQETLPDNNQKLEIFLKARGQFINNGYKAIAMDHFALDSDELAIAFNKNRLYRNFMGYTVKPADEYIGLGVTSIGFLENAFFQNKKTLPDYYKTLDKGNLPIERGKILSKDDQIRQWTINALMCHFYVNKILFNELFGISFDQYYENERNAIKRCETEGLIESKETAILVTELGKIFIRNICMQFDQYLKKQQQSQQRFSRTV